MKYWGESLTYVWWKLRLEDNKIISHLNEDFWERSNENSLRPGLLCWTTY